MKKLKIDVMLKKGIRFYKTLVYTYNPLFKPTVSEIAKFVFTELPSLRNRNDVHFIVY